MSEIVSWTYVGTVTNVTPELSYLVCYRCKNCGKESNLQFTKYTLAPERAQCPKCGCMTMEKVLR